jgi:hypothetical protein
MNITKVGQSASAGYKTQKNTKTYPKGVLRKTARKIEGVKDPSSSPPFKNGIRILTEFGDREHRRKVKATLRHLTSRQIRDKLKKAKMGVSENTPDELAHTILKSGVEAGMIPL